MQYAVLITRKVKPPLTYGPMTIEDVVTFSLRKRKQADVIKVTVMPLTVAKW